MQVDISTTVTHTYRVEVADDIDFDADNITEMLMNAVENRPEIDNYLGAIHVVNEEGNTLYSDSE